MNIDILILIAIKLFIALILFTIGIILYRIGSRHFIINFTNIEGPEVLLLRETFHTWEKMRQMSNRVDLMLDPNGYLYIVIHFRNNCEVTRLGKNISLHHFYEKKYENTDLLQSEKGRKIELRSI